MPLLPRSFYNRPTLIVAEDLLGKVLVHRTDEGVASGTIVEVEAYIGEEDPACHAAPGPTPRNQPLYGPPGFAYVYLNYGVHYLFNVVTEAKGHPAAVLIRALEPLDGIDLMWRRRFPGREPGENPMVLCKGPGNLTKALGIRLGDNRTDLCSGGNLFLDDRGVRVGHMAWSPRIGITVGTEHHWRCYAVDSPAVSGRKTVAALPRRRTRRSSHA